MRGLFVLMTLLGGMAFSTAGGWRVLADEMPVDLELVLAIDISGSVDPEEARLQRDGYVAALADDRVIEAIQGGFLGRIAVTYLEWSGADTVHQAVGWSVIDSPESARAFAAKLADQPIWTGRFTSISTAVRFGALLFDDNGFAGSRRVIDVSGDGPNNTGGLVTSARDHVIAGGITINGLPIVNNRPNMFGLPAMYDLDLYYRNCVIGGAGAFLIVANGFEAFADAILRKLILEIAGLPQPGLASIPAISRIEGEMPDCEFGERQLEQFMRSQRDRF